MHNCNVAVIPAAGLGKRMLPITKSMPKEMIPLVNKPVIEYIVEEVILSGVEMIILVTRAGKETLLSYFDVDETLVSQLQEQVADKGSNQSFVQHTMQKVKFALLQQSKPQGLGHAISIVKQMIDKSSFAVVLPDDLISSEVPCLLQLLQASNDIEPDSAVVAVNKVPTADLSKYGVIDIETKLNDSMFRVKSLVEKPQPAVAPSDYAVIGRYILPYKIFDCIDESAEHSKSRTGEIQLTDAIALLPNVYALDYEGDRQDCGTPAGYAQAFINEVKRREDLKGLVTF